MATLLLKPGQVLNVFADEVIAKNTASTSDNIALNPNQLSNAYTIQWAITSPTSTSKATIDMYLSLDSKNFSYKSTLATGQQASSGPNSDGVNLATLSGVSAALAKFVVTETANTGTITTDLFLMGAPHGA